MHWHIDLFKPACISKLACWVLWKCSTAYTVVQRPIWSFGCLGHSGRHGNSWTSNIAPNKMTKKQQRIWMGSVISMVDFWIFSRLYHTLKWLPPAGRGSQIWNKIRTSMGYLFKIKCKQWSLLLSNRTQAWGTESNAPGLNVQANSHNNRWDLTSQTELYVYVPGKESDQELLHITLQKDTKQTDILAGLLCQSGEWKIKLS